MWELETGFQEWIILECSILGLLKQIVRWASQQPGCKQGYLLPKDDNLIHNILVDKPTVLNATLKHESRFQIGRDTILYVIKFSSLWRL